MRTENKRVLDEDDLEKGDWRIKRTFRKNKGGKLHTSDHEDQNMDCASLVSKLSQEVLYEFKFGDDMKTLSGKTSQTVASNNPSVGI